MTFNHGVPGSTPGRLTTYKNLRMAAKNFTHQGNGQSRDGIASPVSPLPDKPRLQTLLAHLGIASRRRSAELIEAGDVSVNGTVVREPGFRVESPETATIEIGGGVYTLPRGGMKARTIMLNKPVGLICSADESQGMTVFACLDGIDERLVPVGRLDKDSSGLLLLSNNGDLVNRLTHPRFGHVKEYIVTARGLFDEHTLDFLNSPIRMDGYTTRPACVEYIERLPDNRNGTPRHLLKFILAEGRNRQIRNMCQLAQLHVSSLMRTAINGLRLPGDLAPGEWRDLSPRELELLEKPYRESQRPRR